MHARSLALLFAATVLGVHAVAYGAGASTALAKHSASGRSTRLPDWSGVWVLTLQGGAGESGQDASGNDNSRVPLTPKYAKLRAEARDAHAQNNLTKCLPAGSVGVLQHGILFEVLFNPGRVTLLFEDGEVRRIWTDGRPHQKLDLLRRSYEGDSIGHWQGQKLIVDTIGFTQSDLFQNYGLHATLNSHMVEHISLEDPNHIEIDTTLTDPEIFTKPYAYTRVYQHSELPMPEPVCTQYNRDTGDSIDLTPPPEE